MYTKEERQAYYQTHKETMKQHQQKWIEKQGFSSPAEYQKSLRVKARQDIFNLLGNKCAHCGNTDPRVLQIDHKNGGGRKDTQNQRNSQAYYRKVLKLGSSSYQLLCANCNWIKRYENHEHS